MHQALAGNLARRISVDGNIEHTGGLVPVFGEELLRDGGEMSEDIQGTWVASAIAGGMLPLR